MIHNYSKVPGPQTHVRAVLITLNTRCTTNDVIEPIFPKTTKQSKTSRSSLHKWLHKMNVLEILFLVHFPGHTSELVITFIIISGCSYDTTHVPFSSRYYDRETVTTLWWMRISNFNSRKRLETPFLLYVTTLYNYLRHFVGLRQFVTR